MSRNEEYTQGRKNSTRSRVEYKPEGRVSSFIFVLRSLIWEPSRGVAWYRPFSSPAFSTYNGESARSVRWAEVGTHHPQSEKPPLLIRVHPHYVLAAPSATPRPRLRPVCARAGLSCISVCMCMRTTHLHAIVVVVVVGEPFARRDAHACERIRAARHGVQKGRDWQCRGPTCPLPQHGHAPRGSTWSFSSSGWCATVKPALQILRGTHSAGADATNKSYIMDPYLRTYVGLFR